MTTSQTLEDQSGYKNRVVQLIFGIICMAMIANLQYGWTLFVNPIHDKMGWTKAAIQVSFSIFVLTETWLTPIEGWLVDKFGPRPVILFGGVLVGLSWIINSMAGTLPMLYLGGLFAGVGGGCVYGTCVGLALKRFPDKRGVAAGWTAAGFGAGAALTLIPIAHMVKAGGYQSAFFDFGLIQGAVIIVLSLFITKPQVTAAAAVTTKSNTQSRVDYTPAMMIKTPVFWVMYVLFVLIAACGLMATAQIAPIAKDYGLAKIPMIYFGATLPLLTVSLSINSLCNGFTRPLTGWISDRIGRENTMTLMFGLQAVAMLGLMTVGHNPTLFLIFAAIVFLAFGEIFAIFPAISGDTFGPKNATVNNACLYTAKGTGSLLVPIASVLKASTGSWHAAFMVAFIFAVAATLGAKFVLQPMRRRWFANNQNAAAVSQPAS
ncbi:MAG: oxalate/formate MFS antiporter [Proteobacteria bacterium]|nr:oxalate/formate MFS antiporter [Pseudomonadota bacterium]